MNNSHKPANLKIVKGKTSLGLSGMQTKTLLENFTFIFGHLFETEEDKKILNFVRYLFKQTKIIFSKVIYEADLTELEFLISGHLSNVKILFDGIHSRKHHYLTHVPKVIRRLGPAALMSTAPFEGKHVFFTRLIRKTSINKYIVKTIAIRHQCVMSKLVGKGAQHELTIGKATEMTEIQLGKQNYAAKIQILCFFSGLNLGLNTHHHISSK